uniref:Putative pou domain class 4 transcription factor 1 n=1 Tax=Ixodes ricinus TaxID=34613 RepID=A0A147BEF2_IXORI
MSPSRLERTLTASLCLASLRSTPLADKMASPTKSFPLLQAGMSCSTSEMTIGTPCSSPPVIEMPRPSSLPLERQTVRTSPTHWCLRTDCCCCCCLCCSQEGAGGGALGGPPNGGGGGPPRGGGGGGGAPLGGGGGGGGSPGPEAPPTGWRTSASSSSRRSVKSRSLISRGRRMERTSCSHCRSLSDFHSRSGMDEELVWGSSERKSVRDRDAARPSLARLTAPAVETSAEHSVVLPVILSWSSRSPSFLSC